MIAPAVLEKLPPSNVDAEQAVLGALLLDRDALVKIAGWLQPDDFFRDSHKFAFGAMLALYRRNEPVDIITVADELERNEQLPAAGGLGYVHSLGAVVPTAIHVEYYADIVRRTALKRRLIAVAGRIASIGYDDQLEVDEAFDEALGLVTELSKRGHREAGVFSVGDISEAIDALYEDGLKPGVSTGWPDLDDKYRVRRGEWTAVTGMPSCGKSEWLDALVVNLAREQDWRFAMCSPENWPLERHASKLIEKYAEQPFRDGPTPRMDPYTLVDAKAWLDEHFAFVLPDEDHLTVSQVLGLAATAHARRPIAGLVIDPWNEMDHDYAATQTETQYTSAALTKIRRFARRYGIHVWVVAHPTKVRRKEDGSYPVPTLYDIAGSANWRNKADNGICVHRDLTRPGDPHVQIHVQKVRFDENGETGAIAELLFDKVTHTYYSATIGRRRAA